MAWATSALLLVGESAGGQDGLRAACDLLRFSICGGWLWFAWRFAAGARTRTHAKRALVLLIALALPVQGFAGVASELRGPGHFHADDPSAGRHWHGDVEHHHHAADPAVVEIDDGDDHRHAVAAAGDGKRGASAAPDTLTAAAFVFPSRPDPNAVRARDPEKPILHFPGTLERPPRPAGDC